VKERVRASVTQEVRGALEATPAAEGSARPAVDREKVRAVELAIVLGGRARRAETETRAAIAVLGATMIARAREVDSASDRMTVAFLAPRTSARSGPIGLIASGMLDVHAATSRECVPTDGRLDRGHRWRDVQRQERGAHSPR
jgi:hypothetical protein